MRVIEVVAPGKHHDTLIDIAERHEAIDFWWGAEAEDGRRSFRILMSDENRQYLIDALQNLVAEPERLRILIYPIDAALPRPQSADTDAEEKPHSASTTREELYHRIEQGAVTDVNFFLMVILSTIVAAIGLIEDNVAVIIGAMVIAPLLGPYLAFAFGTALGDRRLMWRSLQAGVLGGGVAFAMSVVIGLLWPDKLQSPEILLRTDVKLDSIALALASGAAAVLSLSSGTSTVLVGVMVAVALLPPAAAMGLLTGGGQMQLAMGAGLLLAVNVISVILAAKLVFLFKGIKPRTWLEKEKARQSMTVYILLWLLLLGLMVVFIVLRGARMQ
jgi:uncharacterized hydrophobic protein (TIGR00341 family)